MPAEPPEVVRFGVVATVRFADGEERAFKLVGEDEADPGRGLVSCVAPLGSALLGKAAGASVSVAGRDGTVICVGPLTSSAARARKRRWRLLANA